MHSNLMAELDDSGAEHYDVLLRQCAALPAKTLLKHVDPRFFWLVKELSATDPRSFKASFC